MVLFGHFCDTILKNHHWINVCIVDDRAIGMGEGTCVEFEIQKRFLDFAPYGTLHAST